MAQVKLEGIRKTFARSRKKPPSDVIQGVNLTIDDGEFAVFVGPSGCGKSTLLRLIAGLESATDGRVFIDNRCVNDVEPFNRDVAMVFQSYALYPHMTVRNNMAFGLRRSGMNKEEIKRKVVEAAQTLQIENLLERKPRHLSGGQRQRVAIGRAIVREPKVFLFDEPLSNLDASLRVQMRLEIARLHQRLRATMIYVTHDQVEAMTLADKIVVLNAGRVEQIGPPLDLYHNPCNLFVAGFIGSPRMNFLSGKLSACSEGKAEVILGNDCKIEILANLGHARPGDKVVAGFRPEEAKLSEGGINSLKGRLDVLEHLGESDLAHIRLEADPMQTIILRLGAGTEPREGDAIVISVSPEYWHLFREEDDSAFSRP